MLDTRMKIFPINSNKETLGEAVSFLVSQWISRYSTRKNGYLIQNIKYKLNKLLDLDSQIDIRFFIRFENYKGLMHPE